MIPIGIHKKEHATYLKLAQIDKIPSIEVIFTYHRVLGNKSVQYPLCAIVVAKVIVLLAQNEYLNALHHANDHVHFVGIPMTIFVKEVN